MAEYKPYAGIGSRITPGLILQKMTNISSILSQYGFTLRSGGADGADSAFEVGLKEHQKEIYIPWKGFNNNSSKLYHIPEWAFQTVSQYHPNSSKLSRGALRLMARNAMQLLGEDMSSPSLFVVCWTRGGTISGGTGQAMRMANDYDIPIYNLGTPESTYKLKELISALKLPEIPD